MSLFESFAVLIVFTALFSIINYKFLKLPSTIGVMFIAMIVSLGVLVLGNIFPKNFEGLCHTVGALDFSGLLMEVMLSFLIFAGAFSTDVKTLGKELGPVLLLSTLGVLISTFLVGGLMYGFFQIVGINIPFIHCLLFGSLISPTDPIAVIAILRKYSIPKSLEVDIAGESLLNDGVAVVVFMSIARVAREGVESFSFGEVIQLFAEEALGGALFGAVLGFGAFYLLKMVKDHSIDILITLAVVMGGYLAAEWLHVSGPLTVVVAGLVLGLKKNANELKEEKKYVETFWENIDEILNAVLFLFIGVELIAITANLDTYRILYGLAAIPIVLLSRFLSVIIPMPVTKLRKHEPMKSVAILTWGGLRGGISVALALSIPQSMNGDLFVAITYIIVLFSILVQGLTIGNLVQRLKLSVE